MQRNEHARTRNIGGCLIEAVLGVRSGSAGVLLRTEDTGRLYSDGFLNLSRITWRESSRRQARRQHATRRRSYAWFRIRVAPIRPFDPLLLASVNLSLPFRTRKWWNCASGILFDVRRSIGSIGRAPVNSTGDSFPDERRKSRGRVIPLYWKCGASSPGTLARILHGNRDVLISVSRERGVGNAAANWGKAER